MKYQQLISLFCLFLALTASAKESRAEEVLKEINFAREHPARYANALEAEEQGCRSEDRSAMDETIYFLRHTAPLPPLVFSRGMSMGASSHVLDQGNTGAYGHSGSDSSSPWDRIAAFGKWTGSAGENISYGHADAKSIVSSLIIDAGVWGRGHRKNIFSPDFGVAGVACGPHARYGTMCVIDFAGGFERGEKDLANAHTSWPQQGWVTTGWHRL